MKEYYLFLDESKSNSNFRNFTLGGVAIEKMSMRIMLDLKL